MRGKVGFAYILQDDKITELACVKHKDFYQDIKLQVEAQNRAVKIIEEELGIRLGMSLRLGCGTTAAAVMGCKLVYPENSEPWAIPLLHRIEDVDELEVPEPQDNPVVQQILRKAKTFERLTGVKSNVGFDGPVTTAALCRGVREFFVDVFKAPKLCRRLVEKVTEVAIKWIKYHEEEMGIEPSGWIGLADDHASFLSPKHYEMLGFPYELKFYEAFPERKYRALHICGPTDHLLYKIKDLKLASFELGEMVDLRRARRILVNTHIARLFDFRLLLSGSTDDIVEYTKRQIKLGASEEGCFSIHIEGWRGIAFEKVRLVKKVIEEYNEGRLKL